MTATDERGVKSGYPHTLRPELHKALDAAGIDYWIAQGLTFWNCSDGRECVAYGYQVDGRPTLAMKIVGITDPEQAIAVTLGPCNDSCNCTNGERTDLAAENAMLREQMERLVTLLRNDCDIDASWDGLRRFWSIELTEGGCLMRDRACKAEAENAKLRERIHELEMEGSDHFYRTAYAEDANRTLESENAELRGLVRDVNRAAHMLCEAWEGSCRKEAEGMSLHAVCPISDTNELCVFGKLYERMRELGVEI